MGQNERADVDRRLGAEVRDAKMPPMMRRVLVALTDTITDLQVNAAIRKAVRRAYGHHSLSESLRPALSTAHRAFGTALMLLGIGISVLVVLYLNG